MTVPRQRRRRHGGNAILEFAVGFGVLFLSLSGAAQYGYSMYVYNCLETAVSGGAAFASRATLDTRNSAFETEVKNVVVYGSPSGTGAALAPGLTTAAVSVVRTPSSGFPDRITISISSITVNTVFRTFTFTGKPSVSVRFSGKYRTE